MNKIAILKQLDSVLGRLLVVLLPKSEEKGTFALRKWLFVRPGGIGDAVLLVPVIQAVKKKYPDATIDVLAEKRNAAIFALCPEIDKALLYDQGDLLATLRAQYDVIVDTEQWHRLTSVVTRLIRSHIKVGYGTNERKKLYTKVVSYSHDRYELDSFFDLLQPLGVEPPANAVLPFLRVPAAAQRSARQLLDILGARPYVVLFPGASIAERRWGIKNFRHLAQWLNNYGYTVVVIGGKEDYQAGVAILAGIDGLNLAGKTSLIDSAAIIENGTLLVSGDSGMLHIGVGLGKPTVSLFGSGIAAKWAPKGARHVVINKRLPCSPCTRFGYTPPCPIGIKCLADITVDEVCKGVMSLL